jgi:hypothetical protein
VSAVGLRTMGRSFVYSESRRKETQTRMSQGPSCLPPIVEPRSARISVAGQALQIPAGDALLEEVSEC